MGKINIYDKVHEFLLDSGAEISVMNPKLIGSIEGVNYDSLPILHLRSAFGHMVEAKILEIPVCLADVHVGKSFLPVSLCVALSEQVHGDRVILTPADLDALSEAFVESSVAIENVNISAQDGTPTDTQTLVDTHTLNKTYLDDKKISEFKKEQMSDDTLTLCWQTIHPDSRYFVNRDSGLLYHTKEIAGIVVHRLVVPVVHRSEVLTAAHDSPWSMHFGMRKTLARIEEYFFWSSLIRDVKKYVKSCHTCQLKLRRTSADRVPITAVPLANFAFERVNVDVIGPIEPPSSRCHHYILTLIDSCTKWVEAVPLKGLTARETVDALLVMFTRVGVPNIIIADNGTNFVSGLNKELYKQLGIEMRNSTQGHPEGNSPIERFNQTLKGMLKQIVNLSKPREWDKSLPFLLWAYREIPNDTTGISPNKMMFGHPLRGPLSVLKESWEPDSCSDALSITVKDYLDELYFKIFENVELAHGNAAIAQKNYMANYNSKAKIKHFDVGDQVLVLWPDSSNKLRAQWQGPGHITNKLSSFTYQVKLPSGSVRSFHANDLRLYVARVSSLGVLFEDEEVFGSVLYYDESTEEFEAELAKVDLSYLQKPEQAKVLELLRKHSKAFSSKPGICKVGEHRIHLNTNAAPAKQHAYRVPHKYKAEVQKQIDELLAANKIKKSSSPFCHPLTCVAKKTGEIRLCTDLRYVNSLTVDDSFPIPHPDELLMKISGANFITTLDCCSGFWQIPIFPGDTYKTAFSTGDGLYEWLVMPFGIKTATSTFQRTMSEVLKGLEEYTAAYVDDISVHSHNFSQHLGHVDNILTRFIEVGMTLKLSKCCFARSEVPFIGHLVGSGSCKVQFNKVEAITKIPEPRDKKALRSFLGMCSYYRRHVPAYAEIALPLTELTKGTRNTSIQFTNKERQAFDDLKIALCNAAVLKTPDFSIDFIIRTDASEFAIGACLSQVQDGCEVPLAFVSAKLNSAQRNYSTIEKEAYAIVFALGKFEFIVLGYKINLYTDHAPLQYVTSCMSHSSKLTRWALSLARYNIVVQSIKGKDNVVSDCLSRLI